MIQGWQGTWRDSRVLVAGDLNGLPENLPFQVIHAAVDSTLLMSYGLGALKSVFLASRKGAALSSTDRIALDMACNALSTELLRSATDQPPGQVAAIEQLRRLAMRMEVLDRAMKGWRPRLILVPAEALLPKDGAHD